MHIVTVAVDTHFYTMEFFNLKIAKLGDLNIGL